MDIAIPFIAFVLDKIIGDPRSSLHPVVLIGNLIGALEKLLLKYHRSNTHKFMAGILLAFITLGSTYGIVYFIVKLLSYTNFFFSFLVQSILLSFVISPRSLDEAATEIKNYLDSGQLDQARYKVGWIVGRDTDNLSPAEITRATVETVAENIVDGIISPLFYFAIGGLPLAFLYRAVNTLDSMVGYKNEKYLYFGRCSARIDDVFNYVPARITGVLIIFSSIILCLDTKLAIHSIIRDSSKHPSPNSGIAEAGVAGALGIQLGGLNYYKGTPSLRAHMGIDKIPLSPIHIDKTISIMYIATLLFVLFNGLLLWIIREGLLLL